MKRLIVVFVALGISAIALSSAGKPGVKTENLTITVSGVPSIEGNIYLLIYNQPIGFPSNPEKAYKKVKAKVSSSNQTIVIDKLPAGSYSIVAFHDKNGNNEFDKSWFGSPKESYGFTNIPGSFCGTPSFQQTSFNYNGESGKVEVKLIVVE